jgi:hypothetical protein
MKSEIYNALASLSRGFDVTLVSLKVLNEEGVITAEYVHEQSVRIQELWANVNYMIVHRMSAREMEDREHFGKMREDVEAALRGEELPLVEEQPKSDTLA